MISSFFFLPVFIFFRQGRVLGDHVHPQHLSARAKRRNHLAPALVQRRRRRRRRWPDQTVHVAPSADREVGSRPEVACVLRPSRAAMPSCTRSLSLCVPDAPLGNFHPIFDGPSPARPPVEIPFPQQQQMNEILPVEGLLHNKPSSPHQWNSETAYFERWEPAPTRPEAEANDDTHTRPSVASRSRRQAGRVFPIPGNAS